MTTLPYRRQQVTPRSGGRIAEGRRNAVQSESGGIEEYATYTVPSLATLQTGNSAAMDDCCPVAAT